MVTLGFGTITRLDGKPKIPRRVRQLERKHWHPGVYGNVRAGTQLPGNAIKQVAAHGKMAVAEIQLVCNTVTVPIGKRLQKYRAKTHRLYPVEQQAEITFSLSGIGIVNVI